MISNNIQLSQNEGDYIGKESCTSHQKKTYIEHYDIVKSNNPPLVLEEKQGKDKVISKNQKEKKVFPPPIPLLARTENLASHMPWILKRYYTSEGRLILKEEKKKHHEYFRAHRANGRLTLQLVPLDDDDAYLGTSAQIAKNGPHYHEEVNQDSNNISTNVINGFLGEKNKANMMANVELHMKNNDNDVVGGINGSRLQCLKFINVRSTPPCILGMPLSPVRKIHG